MSLEIMLLLLLQAEFIALAVVVFIRLRPGKKPCFVDTSVLMDGRISSLAETGFLPGNVKIPHSVLHELQLLADGSDSDKRMRARHGLDIASQLTNSKIIDAGVFRDRKPREIGVDDQLMILARRYKGSICTVDFNLNKVAQAEGIAVLNINEVAQQLRMNHLPGEKVSIKIQQKGDGANQGVGYMADGTMVVVERAGNDVDKTINVEFIRSLQTAAGRMLFAKKLTTSGKSESRSKISKATSGAKTISRSHQKSKSARKPKKTTEDTIIDLVG
ncbi:hypothetical protein H6796_02040 [Candidatus Nomurabacteria bacterium]|nr:hypothetical protein [Candidatus Nomurabacteria bacterium]